ncbi:MAG: TIGR03016 family PEP-CTERM system-associated outer membrane protein [Rhodospirillaceae bacterium]|nr:TIGR03016 family PEP-CTERM system-associated outer membrane protein [Rhodospirillaceae bacterium]
MGDARTPSMRFAAGSAPVGDAVYRGLCATAAAALAVAGFGATAVGQTRGQATAPEPPWLFRAGGSIDTTVTDNVLVSETAKETDVIGTAVARAALRGNGNRGRINLAVDLGFDYYAHKTNLNSERYSGLLNGDLDLIQDYFNIAANAATQLQSTTVGGAQPATERSIGQNQTQVLTYSVDPTFRARAGDFASFQAGYSFQGSNFLDPPIDTAADAPASDSYTHSADISIAAGPAFGRFGWTLSGSASDTKLSNRPVGAIGGDNSKRRNGQATLSYRVSAATLLLASGGYDDIEEATLNEATQEPYGRAGFEWRPSDRTEIRLEGGYRYGGPTFDASVSYAPREWLAVRASYTESIETQQQRFGGNLGGVIRDEGGNLIDPITGLDPNVTDPNFDLSDQAFRSNRAQASVGGQIGRNSYALTGSYEIRNANTVETDQWSVGLSLGRQLAPRVTASVQGNYGKTAPVAGAPLPGPLPAVSTEDISASAQLDYQLGPSVYLSLQYIFSDRTSDIINSRENVGVLSLSRRF